MTGKMSRRIVIDASVARAAGETEHPTSRRCREFLQEVLDVCHHMVFTREVEREWKDHRSGFALRWQVMMEQKGKVYRTLERSDPRSSIMSAARSEAARAAMIKDAHLIAAAMAADCVIASLDSRARALFSEISLEVKELGKVTWVPVGESDDVALKWVQAGARAVGTWRLGA